MRVPARKSVEIWISHLARPIVYDPYNRGRRPISWSNHNLSAGKFRIRVEYRYDVNKFLSECHGQSCDENHADPKAEWNLALNRLPAVEHAFEVVR